jgi:hypothetical protein
LVLCLVAAAGCAGPRGAGSGASERPLDDAALHQRTRALEALAEEALHPCAERATPEDRGVFTVSARANGAVALGPFEWLGSPVLLSCLTEGAQRVRLPSWGGPSVTWLWSIGSPRFPAPGLFSTPPETAARLELLARELAAVGAPPAAPTAPTAPTAPAAAPPSIPPPAPAPTGLAACQAWLGADKSARAIFRLFVFPDGRVAGATPVAVQPPGPPPMFLECLGDQLRRWTFPPFAGPGFLALDVTVPP